jgi:DNA end-binding protein Ku
MEAFAVIRDSMKRKGMVALAKIVLAKRERVIMLQPWEKGLMGTTLRYPYELRDSKDYFDDIPDVKLPAEMLDLAEHIIEGKSADFDPAQFVDRYEQAVVEMLKKKQAGMPTPTERPAAAPMNVINLMDALKRSIDTEKKAPAAGAKRRVPSPRTQPKEPGKAKRKARA